MIDHVFLSPHFDDAVGSCGGTMWRLSQAGHRVSVLTIFGGDEVLPLSEAAALFHEKAGRLGAVGARRAEDQAACAVLQCSNSYLDYPDAIYRRSKSGDPLYGDLAALLRSTVSEDDVLADVIADDVLARVAPGTAVVYCPMGIGGHVDHLLVRNCGYRLLERGMSVVFYTDFYYYRSAIAVGRPRHSRVIALTDAEFARKLAAFARYASQVSALFGTLRKMRAHFDDFGKEERFSSLAEPMLRPLDAVQPRYT